MVNGLKALVPFLMRPILTAYLGVNDYGVLSIVEVTILFLVPIVSLNVSEATNVEYFRLERTELNRYIANAFIPSFFAFVIVSFIAITLNNEIPSFLNVDSTLIV